jgi:hypothetical protein
MDNLTPGRPPTAAGGVRRPRPVGAAVRVIGDGWRGAAWGRATWCWPARSGQRRWRRRRRPGPVPAAQAPPPTTTPPAPASQPRARQGPRPPPPVHGMVTAHRQPDPQHRQRRQQPNQLGADDRRGRGDRHHHPGRDQHRCRELPPREAPPDEPGWRGWFAGAAARPRPPRQLPGRSSPAPAPAATTAPACSPQAPASRRPMPAAGRGGPTCGRPARTPPGTRTAIPGLWPAREHLAAARLGRSLGALGAPRCLCSSRQSPHGAGGGPSNVTPRSFANSANIAGAGAAPPVARTTS